MSVYQFPQPFVLVRDEDPTGVSGTGVVVEGVVYTDGTVAYHWVVGDDQTWTTARSIGAVERIHGHGGSTRIVYAQEVA